MNGRILFVCNDRQRKLIVENALKALERSHALYPELHYFLGHPCHVVRHVAAALKFVDQAAKATKAAALPQAESGLPVLIILDAEAPRASNDIMRPIEGQAAADLLEWLQRDYPRVPVLVISKVASARVERLVVSRRHAGLWRMNVTDETGERDLFAEALAGIAPVAPGEGQRLPMRHITVDVSHNSASYRLSNGKYEFLSSNPIAYAHEQSLDFLFKSAASFTPWNDEAQVTAHKAWYQNLKTLGGLLYEVLMRDTVGDHLSELLSDYVLAPRPDQRDIDLRFEIGADNDHYSDLFMLPFELLNDSRSAGVMCLRVPMARRVRLRQSASQRGVTSASHPTPDGPLHVLFIDANVSGNVRLSKLHSPTSESAKTFAKLSTASKELKILQDCALSLGPERMAPPDVIGGLADGLVGEDLFAALQKYLEEGKYDLVHFCGHSATLDDGKTYLIFPGDNGKATGVSVGLFAEWLGLGETRMVVLSSCEGASAMTAGETMRYGVKRMVGFRWRVEENQCVEYFRHFYEKYLAQQDLGESYRFACNALERKKDGDPAWASVLAVSID